MRPRGPGFPTVMFGPQNPCRGCQREDPEELMRMWWKEALPGPLPFCPLHLAALPSALREAVADSDETTYRVDKSNEARRRGFTEADLESAISWSAHLGRPVYPGERVDALAHLIAEGKDRG